MNPLRSVGARLSLALVVVVALALAVVYVALVPTLQRRLVDAKLSQLRRAASALPSQLADSELAPQDFVTNVQSSVNARVVVFNILSRTPLTLAPVADSLEGKNASDVAQDPVATRAAARGRAESGSVTRGDEQYAEAAVPLPGGPPDALLLVAPLHDTLADVDLVQRRLLVAGLIALAASVALGYGAASAFALRIRRLERAADRIAGGDLSQPVRDEGDDEVGQLARAFERMRGRLAQLDDARRAFIANASHELRTPLFSLAGFLELLRDEELDDTTRREFLATASEQVGRLTKLATDLLDLSRLDAGRMRVEHEEVDLAAEAETLAEEFQPVALGADHPLDVVVEGRPAAWADAERVLQIGRILLENALRHTPAGTPVRIVVREPAQLAVVDEGPGISPEDAARVFERFTRLEGGIATGSGLGLAIARDLASLMGGAVTLESRPGWTEFALSLPSAISRENAETPVPASPVA